ncbi:DUF1516 family protein [Peribacillus kribbensis]|uniref:DUF1516 family protein n=1 Tax=Peribacillus kribbensis TaxID=356658 RepID=UPI000425FF06|nr:DUF1516 family protein [Peribacillus kribbensis]
MLTGLYHTHAGSWAILILLFLISYFASRQKITLMIQRLFYLIMLGSGIGMLILGHFNGRYIIKGIAAVILMGIMEMLVARKRKGKKHAGFWIVFVILLAFILLVAYNKTFMVL